MVAKFVVLNNLSWQIRPFALSNDGKKEEATGLFQSATVHEKVIRVSLFRFFLSYLREHGLLRSNGFAIMATWRNFFSFSNSYNHKTCCLQLVLEILYLLYSLRLHVVLKNNELNVKSVFWKFKRFIDWLIDLLLFSYLVVQIFYKWLMYICSSVIRLS